MPLKETDSWFPYILSTTGSADVTNEFLLFGITAGLGAMTLFIVLLTRAFRSLGVALSAVRGGMPGGRDAELMLWSLGVMLAMHIVNWLGITYFDQTGAIWFMQLATVSNVSAECLRKAVPAVVRPVRAEAAGEPATAGFARCV